MLAPVQPSVAAAPCLPTLGPTRRRAYERHGFVLIPDVFPHEELAALDAEIDRLCSVPGTEAGGTRAGWIYAVARQSDLTARFAEDQRLLSLIQEVVFPGLAIHSSKLVAKLPHSEDICHWHQDEAFYTKADDPATQARRRMSVWVPMRDADEENGCLWVVPGSHRWGMEPWTWQETGACQKRLNRLDYAEAHAVALPAPAGSVVLFSAWTWHHSKNNRTENIRRAFIVSYQEATATRGAGEQWKVLHPAAEGQQAPLDS